LAIAALVGTGCLNRPVGDATPTTTNLVVQTLATNALTKIDLLFMIDNSRSMADKQVLLEKAVPVLLGRLVTPNCLDDAGAILGAADTLGRCAAGTPEFRPIRDIHIGIITSSLGNHGGSECTPGTMDVKNLRTPDDRAELLPTANPAVRGPLPSWNDSGFLAWDPGQAKQPPGERDFHALRSAFGDQVAKAGEYGCGYEASLEAWYRFLVDPDPPVSVSASANHTRQGPVNQTLLAQRDAFLRPDSLLAIVMLTDENDCSITDQEGSQGFLASSTGSRLPRASAACAADPNDRCCHSCALEAEPGCTPNAEDAECSKPAGGSSFPYLSESEDDSFLRCFDQKRRFGLDFLYPVQRYIDALTKPTVPNRAGVAVANPIFAPNAQGERRSKDLVLLAGIVGVPWQDLSTRESWSGTDLEYLTAEGLEREGRWPLILGSAGVPPTDPLMRESVAPRSGMHPLLGIPMVLPGSGQPDNPVNGHEQLASNDLQFACTFPLPPGRPCTDDNCDCTPKDRAKQSSLCTYPDDPMAAGTQIAAKAYPGTRHLEVLKGLGKNAIVASICPKNTSPAPGLSDVADRAYGYNPAIAALLDLMKTRFPTQCLPRRLEVESDPTSPDFGHVPCVVVEAAPKRNGECSCDRGSGRIALGASDGDLPRAVTEQMQALAVCDGTSGVSCKDYCQCKIAPLEGEQLAACQAGAEDGNLYGYCYVDPAQGIGREELVKECAPTARRMLRFPGDGLPANGATTFMACFGAQLDSEEPNATP
jgi:hypothetical protein